MREIFAYLDTHILPDCYMYERAMFTYFKALCKFRKASFADNLVPLEQYLFSFKALGCFELANQAQDEISQYRREAHICYFL